ncbi:hypothetical protein L2E82_18317 [Cichorium intybus]|uniref:Uncharacterized protein n=1 Tax=Cichorium intybus TaxID=13427 RepID=A0ACB9F949_CICIN|nr:hypothetical protein L2E82_18317 [Cichorium intybus]
MKSLGTGSRLHRPRINIEKSSPPSKNKYGDSKEFGRDTNRLDYFRVTAFDVFDDDHLSGIAGHGGGGGGGRRDRGVVVGPRLEQKRGSVIACAGQRDRTREVPDNGSDGGGALAAVQRLEQKRDGGGGGGSRRGRSVVVGRRHEQEKGCTGSGVAGGGITT